MPANKTPLCAFTLNCAPLSGRKLTLIVQSEVRDFGLWTTVFTLENPRSSEEPSRSSSTCQNKLSRVAAPSLSGRVLIGSRAPCSSPGQRSGCLFGSCGGSPCASGSERRQQENSLEFLQTANNTYVCEGPSHLTGVIPKAAPSWPPLESPSLKWHRACA